MKNKGYVDVGSWAIIIIVSFVASIVVLVLGGKIWGYSSQINNATFFGTLFGIPILYGIQSNKTTEKRQATERKQRDVQANEIRLANKCAVRLANAPTTLIADALKHDTVLSKIARESNNYSSLIKECAKRKIDLVSWKDENVSIFLNDNRLNTIELDVVIKQLKF